MPLFFAFVTGFFTLESFERWRVYLPSVGIFIFCVVIAYDIFFWLNKKYLKGLFAAALLLLFGFHTLRVVNAEQNWREASHELQKLKEEIKPILAAHPERPLKLLFLTKPAKLGGAPLMQLALTDFLSQAELERTNDASLVTGGKPYDGIEGEPAVSLYTTEENKNFSGLSVEKINDSSYRVSVTNDSQIKLIPAINKEEGIAKRDQEFKDGDTLRSDLFLLIFEKTEKVTAQRIRVEIIDRSYLPLYYIEGKWHADNADGTDFHR